jgi:hypothetical protein
MKTVFFAASAALSLGIGSAYADGGGQAQTMFTMIQDPQSKAAATAQPAAAQNADEVTRNYLTRSHRSTSMFPANQNEGGNN